MLDREQINDLKKQNLKFSKEFVEIPSSEWGTRLNEANRKGDKLLKAWRNRYFLVQLFSQTAGSTERLSIQRTEYSLRKKRFEDGITWDELQTIKSQVGFGDRCALEVYPPDDRVVNVANIRHLFLLPVGASPLFVWDERDLSR